MTEKSYYKCLPIVETPTAYTGELLWFDNTSDYCAKERENVPELDYRENTYLRRKYSKLYGTGR